MTNTSIRTFLLLLATSLTLLACEKLDLPAEENDSSEKAAESQTSSDNNADTEAYSVAEAIAYHQHDGEVVDIYVVGYIVGYVQHTSIKSSTFAAGDSRTNLLLADTPVETDSLKCIPVQLSTANQACKATRIALNLYDNPNMLHQKVRLKGNLDLYMGVCGLLKAHDHSLLPDDFDYAAYKEEQDAQQNESKTDGEETSPKGTGEEEGSQKGTDEEENSPKGTDEEENSPKGTEEEDPRLAEARKWFSLHGTADNPFDINDFKTTIATYYPIIDEAGYRIADIYVRGYIVGYYTTSNKVVHFSTNANKEYATNIVLADSPDELKKANCIVVELPSGSRIRDELNLFNNKKNLGKRITIFGNIEKYGIELGVKNPRSYTIE